MKPSTDKATIREALSRSVDKVYPTPEALENALLSGRRLRIYLGIDPTSPHLHIGHAASLWTLKRFQELGHEVVLLIGDFTARIGDPTDKTATRQPLSEEQIKENLRTFKKQAEKIVSFSGPNAATLAFNSKWHDKMKFKELIRLAQEFTVQQMIERDMFQKRLKEGKPIGLHEFLYPLMQGYDSVALDVDMEVGGTDQTFNMLAGRTLMKSLMGKEKFVLTNRLLVDAQSGKKLSKTEGSLINLDDAPNDMFGKTMAIPDEMIPHVAELSTAMPLADIRRLAQTDNPRDAKLALAFELTRTYYGEKEAAKAKENWIKTFSKKETPEDVRELRMESRELRMLEVLIAAGVQSKSEARRLLEQGAVKVNGTVVKDPNEPRRDGDIVKIGKKEFVKIISK
ncbi:tyrosine--tRNA ligase [Patescibacteria group bacterium]|nr:tyrosine--tRNA ligase [Patescibacteria group bacterium]